MYQGKMPEADYDGLSQKASAYLNRITFNRAKNYTGDEIKDACCAVADVMLQNEGGRRLSSESVGSWSRQYKISDSDMNNLLYEAAEMYLALTGLLYSGGGR
ncbi:MAG: hypothetical protein PHY71_02200 [Bacteroidaceae bacterium]|nr:hypothetical protein [Bacteroidaceae bacterium]